MDRETLDRLTAKVDEGIRERLPDSGIARVQVLQYGDDPAIEPGELLVRVHLEAADSKEGRGQALEAFHTTHRDALKQLRREMREELPEVRRLEFFASDDTVHGPRIALGFPGGPEERASGDLTPVMARLGPVDLETLDTLITAGIATSRADAVRWTLARIRERPAYAKLRQRTREIEDLKAQF